MAMFELYFGWFLINDFLGKEKCFSDNENKEKKCLVVGQGFTDNFNYIFK